MSELSYGGQAVIEGVMMRGANECAVVVRNPAGELAVHTQPLPEALYRGRISKMPFLRGLAMLWDSLGLGMRALTWSADVSLDEEEDISFSGPLAWGTVAFSLALGVGIFFLLPSFLTSLLDNAISSAFVSNLVEGLVRLVIFLGYIWGIGFMPDIKRVFAYHGAEHKTINAYSAGAPLEAESVAQYPRFHTRCGTGFLLIVVFIFVILSTIMGRPTLLVRLASRLVLIPIVAGISYEVMKLLAKNYEKQAWARILVTPGLYLQRLTTREPDEEMIEVGIRSLQEVLYSEGILERPPEHERHDDTVDESVEDEQAETSDSEYDSDGSQATESLSRGGA